ncbi:hypothetical protein C2845_PM05G17590 [Panicum miliaceum]|uniref:Uncharacterized protein n=1 Tax=Panicum miliaceum TaxID=4540 RepID=A0A3L6T5Y9_PANMI|nr:hypothetical protein C2845_PM05G17590 [Panicum miliaceum]
MARTYQTARKRTGGRQVRIALAEPAHPALVPAPFEEEEAMEEEPEEAYYFVDGDDGRMMAIDEEGNQFKPPASPVVEAPPPPPVVPAPAPAPAPVAAEGSPGNSEGIDDGRDDDEDNDNNEDNDDQGDDPPGMRQLCYVRTSDREPGHLSLVLQGIRLVEIHKIMPIQFDLDPDPGGSCPSSSRVPICRVVHAESCSWVAISTRQGGTWIYLRQAPEPRVAESGLDRAMRPVDDHIIILASSGSWRNLTSIDSCLHVSSSMGCASRRTRWV